MIYNLNNKEIKIPDEDIVTLMKSLDLTKEEAIETWLDDNDYTVNEEVERLTKKAKDNRIMATIHEAKSDKPRAKRVVEKKEDPVKENIIKKIAEVLSKQDNLKDIKITNIGKIIEFDTLDGESFKLDLIRRRKKK